MDTIIKKQTYRLLLFSAATAALITVGCSKDESEVTPPPAAPPSNPVSVTGTDVSSVAPPSSTQAKPQANTPTPTLDELPKAPSGAEQITLEQLSNAIQQYVGAHQIDPREFTEKDLPKLVTEQFIAYWTPPPAGKKYVWDDHLQVSLADR